MPKTNFTKIKLLKLWEILSVGSDEDHPLSTSEIIDKLKSQGVECDRKTLYEDIRTLNEYGYEVLCEKGQRSNRYCVVDRSFDVPELHILMDAVQAAGFITEKKTAELTFLYTARELTVLKPCGQIIRTRGFLLQ